MKFTWFLILVLYASFAHAQLADRINKNIGISPIFFLDSVEVSSDTLPKLSPFGISAITVVSKKKAKKQLGDKGSDGAVYITSIKFAKENYWKFLCSVSNQYKQLIASPTADSTVQYVLNGELLTDQAAPGKLFGINKKSFKRLQIKDSSYLVQSVSCFPSRRYVIIIKAKHPKGEIKLSSYKN